MIDHEPPCPVCGEPLHRNNRSPFRCHVACEPTTCTCDTPRPDGLGECQSCRRLVLTHSWHEGRPTSPLDDLAVEWLDPGAAA